MHVFKTIFKDPFLFHAMGTDWRLSKFCLVGGLVLMVVGVLFAVILAIHTKVQWRRVSSADAANVAFYGSSGRGEVLPATKGVGVAGAELKMSIDIDGFRRAARKGDWITFFVWPISISCWIIGVWMVLSTFLLHMPPGFWVMITIVILGMEAICLFMPFAAIFTNIDAGVGERAAAQVEKKT